MFTQQDSKYQDGEETQVSTDRQANVVHAHDGVGLRLKKKKNPQYAAAWMSPADPVLRETGRSQEDKRSRFHFDEVPGAVRSRDGE